MERSSIQAMNPKRAFEPGEYAQIARKYVYALQDPDDQRIFYVGQGTGNRIFEHFNRAEILLNSDKRLTPKFEAIHTVWSRSRDVRLVVLAGGLSDREADLVESATLDALSISPTADSLMLSPHHTRAWSGSRISQLLPTRTWIQTAATQKSCSFRRQENRKTRMSTSAAGGVGKLQGNTVTSEARCSQPTPSRSLAAFPLVHIVSRNGTNSRKENGNSKARLILTWKNLTGAL